MSDIGAAAMIFAMGGRERMRCRQFHDIRDCLRGPPS